MDREIFGLTIQPDQVPTLNPLIMLVRHTHAHHARTPLPRGCDSLTTLDDRRSFPFSTKSCTPASRKSVYGPFSARRCTGD
jgi:hypothetical protein